MLFLPGISRIDIVHTFLFKPWSEWQTVFPNQIYGGPLRAAAEVKLCGSLRFPCLPETGLLPSVGFKSDSYRMRHR
jgi:hypothetical protein